ncbi:MAG: CHAT domain-containing protein [Thermoleophilaceae bacterium]|nr:CHAT domain-containing protein [Thermoleophilaceae bacterium]
MARGEIDRSALIGALERLSTLQASQAAWTSVLELLELLDAALARGDQPYAAQLTQKLFAVSGTREGDSPPPFKLRRRLRKIAVDTLDATPEEVSHRALEPGVVGALFNIAPMGMRGGEREPSTAEPRMRPRGRARRRVHREEPAAPPPPEPERVDVAFGARMPATVALGDTVAVEVEITRGELEDPGPDDAHAKDRAPADPNLPIVLRLLPQGGFEVKGEDAKEVGVPSEARQPANVRFEVTAVHASPGEVWVTVDQGSLPLALLKLRTEIVDGGSTSADASAASASTVAGGRLPAYKRLKITEKVVPGQGVLYEYDVDLPDIPWNLYRQLIPGDRERYVASLYAQLEDWARKPGNAEDMLENLRSFGVGLFRELFPEELRRLLWENRDQLSGVMVLSTEPFIPWELVHLVPPDDALPAGPEFLGQKGVVRWLYGSRPPEADLTIRRNRCRYVIPKGSGLTATAAEREMLEKLGARPIDPRLAAVRNVLAEEDGFDLLHFAGHAEADGSKISMAKVLLDPPEGPPPAWGEPPPGPDPLFASVVESHGRFGSRDHRPMVVLNACQSSRTGMQLSSLGGFAEAFLKKEAGAFVGTLWAVGDKPAMTFVEALYERLIDGDTFSAATARARETARAAGDPSWLAYAVYAPPDVTVKWAS